jgi:hypothetical protein
MRESNYLDVAAHRDRNAQADLRRGGPVSEDGGRRAGLAFMVACPACAGGAILALGAVLGLSALFLKSVLLVAVLAFLGFLWGRNIWRRRNEDRAACPPGRDGDTDA